LIGVTRARLQMLGAAALFSTGGAAIKGCSLSSLQVAGFRSLVAACALALLMPTARRALGRRPALVAVAYAATLILFVAGNKLTTAANTIFLQSTAPLYVLLLSPWLLRERLRRVDLAFMALTALGLAAFFIGVEPARQTAPDPVRGNVLAVASGVTWALTLLGLRWLSRAATNTDDGAAAQAAVILGNLFAFVAAAPWAFPVENIGAKDLLLLAYLGVFQIGLAYALLTVAMHELSAFEASLLLLLEPVLNPIWAWLLHGEAPGGWALAGGGLVLLATAGKTLWEARATATASGLT
jgi:drug/metabolite transporter, DME family